MGEEPPWAGPLPRGLVTTGSSCLVQEAFELREGRRPARVTQPGVDPAPAAPGARPRCPAGRDPEHPCGRVGSHQAGCATGAGRRAQGMPGCTTWDWHAGMPGQCHGPGPEGAAKKEAAARPGTRTTDGSTPGGRGMKGPAGPVPANGRPQWVTALSGQSPTGPETGTGWVPWSPQSPASSPGPELPARPASFRLVPTRSGPGHACTSRGRLDGQLLSTSRVWVPRARVDGTMGHREAEPPA